MASIVFIVSGVSATGFTGSELVPVNFGYGWGSPPWGGAPPADPTIGWGAYPPAYAESYTLFTGLGTVSVTGSSRIIETGFRLRALLGNESIAIAQSISITLTGIEAAVEVFDVSVATSVVVSIDSGLSIGTATGDGVVAASARLIPSPVSAVGAVPSVSFRSSLICSVQGISATFTLPEVGVIAPATFLVGPLVAYGVAHRPSALAASNTLASALVAGIEVDDVSVYGLARVIPTPLSGTTTLASATGRAGAISEISTNLLTFAIATPSVTGKAVELVTGVEGVSGVTQVSVFTGNGVSIAAQTLFAEIALPNVSVVGVGNVSPTPILGSITLNQSFVRAAASTTITELPLAATLADPQVSATSVFIVSGVHAFLQVSDVSLSVGSSISIFGFSGVFSLSDTTITAPYTNVLQGFQLSTALGTENAFTSIRQDVFNVVATVILPNNSTAKAGATTEVSQLTLSGAVANVTSFIGNAVVSPFAVEASITASNVGTITGTGVSVPTGTFLSVITLSDVVARSVVTVLVDGVGATGAYGNESVSGNAIVVIGSENTAFQSYLLAFQGLNFAFQQGADVKALTGYIGGVEVLNTVDYVPNGVRGDVHLALVTVSNSVVVTLDGIQIQSTAGTTSVRSNTALTPISLQSNFTLTNATVTGTALFTVSGVQGLFTLANATTRTNLIELVSGVEATFALSGNSVVTGKASTIPSSLPVVGSIGFSSVLIQDNIFISAEALSATIFLEYVTIFGVSTFVASGVSAAGSIGDLTVRAASNTTLSALPLAIELGIATARMGNTVQIIGGIEASGEVADVTIIAYQPTVFVDGVIGVFSLNDVTYANTISGVSCVGYIGELQIWTNVNDDQECNWVAIPKGACNPWAEVDTPCGPATFEVFGVAAEAVIGEAVVLSGIIADVFGLQAEVYLGDFSVSLSAVVTLNDPYGDLEAKAEVGLVTIDIVNPQFVVVEPRSLLLRNRVGNETIVTTSSTTVRVSEEEAAVSLGDVTINVGQVISIQSGLQARARLASVIVLAYGGWGIPRWGGDSDPPTGWGDQGLAA